GLAFLYRLLSWRFLWLGGVYGPSLSDPGRQYGLSAQKPRAALVTAGLHSSTVSYSQSQFIFSPPVSVTAHHRASPCMPASLAVAIRIRMTEHTATAPANLARVIFTLGSLRA